MIQFSLVATIQRTYFINANLELIHVSCFVFHIVYAADTCGNFVCGCGFGDAINVDNHTLHTAFQFHFWFHVIPFLNSFNVIAACCSHFDQSMDFLLYFCILLLPSHMYQYYVFPVVYVCVCVCVR